MRVRVGLIGLGKAGVQHAAGCVKAADAVSIVAAADPLPAAAAEATRLGCAHYPDWREMIARETLDAVIVSLPHGLLAEAATASAERGLHVLLEKPMGVSLAEADRVRAAARGSGARVMVNFVHRFRGEYRHAKMLLENGAIGKPVVVLDAITSGRSPLPGWVWDREMAGGGMMMYNGVHSIDRLIWLAGSPIERISGAVSTATYPVELEDTAVAAITFRNGTLGVMVQHKADTPQTVGDWRTTIWGTRGGIRLLSGGGLEVISDKERATMSITEDDRFYGAVREFATAIQTGRQPIPSGEDGRHALAAVMALYTAAARHTVETVTDPAD